MPAATNKIAPIDRNRQQQPEANAGEVNPEVAEAAGACPSEAADQGERDCDADRRGGEVLNGQPGHLNQVAHRGLTRIGLPIGVRREAHRGVPRLIRCDAGKPQAERKMALQPKKTVEEQD